LLTLGSIKMLEKSSLFLIGVFLMFERLSNPFTNLSSSFFLITYDPLGF